MSARAPAAPLAAPLAALLFALALAGFPAAETALDGTRRAGRSLGLPPGCLYEGRWFKEGARVPTGEACLLCACSGGALTCRRRTCAPLPAPPPRRCRVQQRRGSCCPELTCPEGVVQMDMEHNASARFEDEDVAAPASVGHACVEGGTVWAAGSAMRAGAACEQCFCLGGARRCVRPRCLPPPRGCRARPAPGACCPQRYYCEHDDNTTTPPHEKHPHDCKILGKWISEGEKIVSGAGASDCTACFCLRGAALCQPLACAPPLLGCTPLLRAGDCCAHQYHCPHDNRSSIPQLLALTTNALPSARNDHDTSQDPLPNKKDTTTKTTLASVYLVKNTRITSATNNLVSTTKVKRKTSDPPPAETASVSSQNSTEVASTKASEELATTVKVVPTTEAALTTSTTLEPTTEATSTNQPEGSVRIMINGTINCTAELSSTSLPLNFTFNDTEKQEMITMESQPRIPLIDVSNLDDHTFSPDDIITDRNVYGDFDENESFVINVTSSLITNTSHTSTAKPPTTIKPTQILTKVSIPTDIAEAINSSKKTKGDYDYDYPEPTLPPSLPNLKIIPFLAADAVVEDVHPKETHTYQIHEREDKFPVYYPSINDKDTSFTRREDAYQTTQYPVFITEKGNQQYPSMIHGVDLTSTGYSIAHNDLGTSGSEYAVPSLDSRNSDHKKTAATPRPVPRTTFKLETPAKNLFSPPVETEGGFVPKGPTGLIDEYYAVFPSTPSAPAVPHHTTSMQLDIAEAGECVSSDGRRIRQGDTLSLACSECACARGRLRCTPRACPAPARCHRRPAARSSADLCCGELVCDDDIQTSTSETTTVKQATTLLSSTLETTNETLTNDLEILANSLVENITHIKVDEPVSVSYQGSISSGTHEPIHRIQNASKTTPVSKDIIGTQENYTNSNTTENVEQIDMKQILTSSTAVPSSPPEPEEPLEYEEEDDDEGFSFGNVLKLLLSGDTYETTTTVPKRTPPTTTTYKPPRKRFTTASTPRPTLPSSPKPTVAPFLPMPHHSFIHPKLPQNPINRIDHLVLGEVTAIKRTTTRSLVTSPRPISTSRPPTRATTQRIVTTEVTRKEEQYTSTEGLRPPAGPGLAGLGGSEGLRPPAGPGLAGLGGSEGLRPLAGPGLAGLGGSEGLRPPAGPGMAGLGGGLKLAGCNIYGRMYRVGRIIAELSTPCQECWCTEFGVQCKDLRC